MKLENSLMTIFAWLNDESPLVRGATIDVLNDINTTDYIHFFLPLLNDSIISIRIKAFYGLIGLDESQVPEEYKEAYQKVKKVFFTHLNFNSDFLGGRIKWANYYLKQGNIEKGILGYESALKIENMNNQVRMTLANLYYSKRDYVKTEKAFKMIIKQEPEYGPTYYSLGLLFAELNQTVEAIEQLKMAVEKMPNNIRIYYNLSLHYDKQQDEKNAENVLLQALKIDASNESILYAGISLLSI